MTPERWQQIDAILDAVLDLDPAERPARLHALCGTDPDLRREVEELLHAEMPSFLDEDVAAFVAPALSAEEDAAIGQRVGPYRLVREIGRGGMGVVYLAERDEVERQVALKLVRGGLADPALRQRFLHEQRVLARLEHPHIARLYDVGLADDGTPYFALEYVEGQPLGNYCDTHRLPLETRLRLFQEVGRAVQHAHQHFVVHRDLKPSNILVMEDEAGHAQVKLLDFGIAKVLAETDENEHLTQTGRHLLTPAYAAPEQIRGGAVTAATDVYALGVVLYELLTGRRPYEATGADNHTAPKKPSTAVTDVADGTTTETASARATTTERLQRRLRGDLDVICLKALAQEPERRYASAEAFVEDIRRHLEGLPVLAQPPTSGYRTKKFMQRHRQGALGTAAIVGLLAVVILFYTTRLQEQRDAARLEAQKAERVSAFLTDLFIASDPYEELQGDTLRARDLLDRGAARIADELAEEPEVQATMMQTIGTVYQRLGLYEPAQALLDGAAASWDELVGEAHPERARSLRLRSELAWKRGHYAAAESLARTALEIEQPLYGAEHLNVAQDLRLLGMVLHDQGDYAEAESLQHQALAIQRVVSGAESQDYAESLNELVRTIGEQGRYAEAESLYAEVLEITRRTHGAGHPYVAEKLQNIAYLQRRQGKNAEAEANYREALAIKREALGETHPSLALTMNNLGIALGVQGRYEEAEPLFREALEIRRGYYGNSHPEVARSLSSLATLRRHMGDLDTAYIYVQEALDVTRQNLGEAHPDVAHMLDGLGQIEAERGNYAAAERYFREALAMQRQFRGNEHEMVALVMSNLAVALIEQRRYAEAEPILREALTMNRTLLGEEHTQTAGIMRNLGRLLTATKRYAESETLLLEALRVQHAALAEKHPRTAQIRQNLADLYDAWSKPDEAAKYRDHADAETPE